MHKQILAAGCSFFIAFATGALARDAPEDQPTDSRHSAGSLHKSDANRADRHPPRSDKAPNRSADERTRSPSKETEQDDDRVEGSNSGTTATESGASRNPAAGASNTQSGDGVVEPKEP